MRRFLHCVLVLLLALCVFFSSQFSILANASEITNIHELLGFEYDEFQGLLDEYGTYTFEMPVTYEDSDLYLVEENIDLSTSGVAVSWVSGYSGSGTIAFGTNKIVTNSAQSLTLTLYNDGSLLFESPGTFNMLLDTYGQTFVVQTTQGGVVSSTTYTGSSTGYLSTPVSINNSNADLNKVQIIISNGLVQSSGDTYLAGGITKYGYILDEVAVDEGTEATKNIFELLKEFIGGFWDNIKNAFSNAIETVLGGLFLPSEDFIKEKTETLKEQVYDSLGLLIWPIAWLQDLFDELLSADETKAIFVFPELTWEGLTVVPETSFDLYSFFYSNGFGFAIDVCQFATSVVLVGAFLVFCQDTLRRVLDDN